MRRIAPLFLPEWPFGLAPVGGGAEKPCNPGACDPSTPSRLLPPKPTPPPPPQETTWHYRPLIPSNTPKNQMLPLGAWQPLVPEMNATCRYWADHTLLRTQSSPVSYPFHLLSLPSPNMGPVTDQLSPRATPEKKIHLRGSISNLPSIPKTTHLQKKSACSNGVLYLLHQAKHKKGMDQFAVIHLCLSAR